MLIRDALIQQNPSLMLQRAASDEIARLDAKLERAFRAIEKSVEALYSRDSESAIRALEDWL